MICDFKRISEKILEVFLLGWQLLVLLGRGSSFHSLHLPSDIRFMIFYLLNFSFYRFGLECILIALFGITSITTSDFHGTLLLALGLVGMHCAAASMWALMKFLYSSFGVLCRSDISWRVSNLFLTVIFIANIAIGKWGPVVTCGFFCFLFLRRLGSIFAETILWSEDNPLKEEYASQFKALVYE